MNPKGALAIHPCSFCRAQPTAPHVHCLNAPHGNSQNLAETFCSVDDIAVFKNPADMPRFLAINAVEPDHPQLADFLQVCQSSQEEDRPALKCSPKQAVKALSWLARTAQIADLATLLSNTLIRSFSLPCAPQERKEALPLPLATLVAWEQKLLQPDCPASLGLLLGGVLLAAHCSLRFKDLQRIVSPRTARHVLGHEDNKPGPALRLPALRFHRDQHVHILGGCLASPSRAGVASHENPLHAGHHTRLLAAMPFATRYRPRPSLHRTDVVFSGPIFHKMGAANPLVATRLRPGYTDRGIGFHAAQLENMPFERLCTAKIAGRQPPPAGPPQAVLRPTVLQRRHN